MKCSNNDCADDATYSITIHVAFAETAGTPPSVGSFVLYKCVDHIGDLPDDPPQASVMAGIRDKLNADPLLLASLRININVVAL